MNKNAGKGGASNKMGVQ